MSTTTREPVKSPPTFTDKAGNVWTIDPTLGSIDTVLANTQVDLLPDSNDPSEITGLLFKQRKLGAVLWEFCQEQATSKGIDRAKFVSGFNGKAIAAGWGALVDGIYFFIQSQSPKVAAQWMELVEAQMRLVETGAEELTKALQSEQTKVGLAAAVADLGKGLQTEMSAELAKFATSSQPSPTPIRDRFRSDS